eukprot:jgi/Hompol1/1902/HPOL_004993-RA
MSLATITPDFKPHGFVPVKAELVTILTEYETTDVDDFVIVDAIEAHGSFVVSNQHLQATFDSHGRLTSLIDEKTGRELVPEGQFGNVFRYYDDVPLFWDAWDVEVYHLEKNWVAGVGKLAITETGPLRVVLTAIHQISATSTLEQRIILTATSRHLEFENSVFWNENHKMLKVEFPFNISSDVATYETQYGFIQRPTHFNTSWDLAKFEVCGHKFVDFSEYGFGVSLLNDSKYGFSVHGNVMSMSILRAPKAPDNKCDIGVHSFKYALRPHSGSFHQSDAVRAGYEFNVPLLVSKTATANSVATPSLFTVDQPNIVLDTIKIIEDARPGEKTLVLRIYEAYGGRGTVKIRSAFPIWSAWISNILEEPKTKLAVSNNDSEISVAFTPFKLVSILVTLK